MREAGSTDYVDVIVRDAITCGLIPGPRIHAAGPALGSTGGHADVNGWSHELAIPGTGAIVDGPDAIRRQVRLNVKYGADQIKFVATGGILSVGDAVYAPQFGDDEMKTLVDEATRLGRKVMAHAHVPRPHLDHSRGDRERRRAKGCAREFHREGHSHRG